MTKQRLNDIHQELKDLGKAQRDITTRVVNLNLERILLITRSYFPTVRYIELDMSEYWNGDGSLRVGNTLLDHNENLVVPQFVNDNIVETPQFDKWYDAVFDSFMNLERDDTNIWGRYKVQLNGYLNLLDLIDQTGAISRPELEGGCQ